MIFQTTAQWRASGHTPSVCIIGSGPAGLSLALGLGRRGVPCLVLEAGGFDYEPEVQDAYRGSLSGDDYYDLSVARLRYFGGSSGHWQGWCRALDAVDFEARLGVPDSGWPITRTDLDPYAAATQDILGIAPIPPDIALSPQINEIFMIVSDPVRFGVKYRAELAESSLVAVLLHAPVVDIVPVRASAGQQGPSRIGAVRVHTPDRVDHQIQAPYFCLCTGGVENSRLLLWANAMHHDAVAPAMATLGRYWMEHPHYDAGDAVMSTGDGNASTGLRFFAPSASALRSSNIGNVGLRMFAGKHRLKRLLKSAMCVAPAYFDRLVRGHDESLACGMQLRAAWEQLPHADNRLELYGERDALGMARVRLTWRKRAAEHDTIRQAMLMFGGYLITADLGRVRLPAWLADEHDERTFPDVGDMGGFHHMGGTRMASSPTHGVVDRNCRVFGVENLFVAGSSVFPTGGHANPTYSIVQLALRLADHLAGELRR